MIIGSKAPRAFETSAQGTSSSSPVATSHSSRFNDLPLPELSGNSSPRVTGDSSAPVPRAYNSIHNELPAFDEEHPNDEPPPAYEAVAVSPTSHHRTRRVLRRPTSGSTSTSSYQSDSSLTRIDTQDSPLSTPAKPSSPCFQRPVPETSGSTTTFGRLAQPFVIHANTSKHELPDLFPTTGISALQTHDVREEDWEYLLQDVVTRARFSSGQRVVSGVLPLTRWLGPPGCLARFAVEQGMRKQKISKVLELLDAWNERFFGPRKLEIILCKGDKCKSGRRAGFLAPDRMNVPPTTRCNAPSSHTSGACEAGERCCHHSKTRAGEENLDKAYRLVVISVSS